MVEFLLSRLVLSKPNTCFHIQKHLEPLRIHLSSQDSRLEPSVLQFLFQMLTNPPLLFCDEPTSGVDTYMATNVIQTLKNMADRGRTVLCSIHQPSSDVFEHFHKYVTLCIILIYCVESVPTLLTNYKYMSIKRLK